MATVPCCRLASLDSPTCLYPSLRGASRPAGEPAPTGADGSECAHDDAPVVLAHPLTKCPFWSQPSQAGVLLELGLLDATEVDDARRAIATGARSVPGTVPRRTVAVTKELVHATRGTDATTSADDADSGEHAACRWSVADAECLLGVSYTARPLIESAATLRDYEFWGLDPAAVEDRDPQVDPPPSECGCPTVGAALDAGFVSPCVAVGPVPALTKVLLELPAHAGSGAGASSAGAGTADEEPQSTPPSITHRRDLGLFAARDIVARQYLCEYTGLIRSVTRAPGAAPPFDGYGMGYPSIAGAAMSLSASSFGNESRCVNHTSKPERVNVRFAQVVHRGMVRVVVAAATDVAAGSQLLADYGAAYWAAAPFEPLDMCAP